jgi:hypothetical protein
MASTVTQFPPATYSSSYFLRNVIKEVRKIFRVLSLHSHSVLCNRILVGAMCQGVSWDQMSFYEPDLVAYRRRSLLKTVLCATVFSKLSVASDVFVLRMWVYCSSKTWQIQTYCSFLLYAKVFCFRRVCLPCWREWVIVSNGGNVEISEKQACFRKEVMERIEGQFVFVAG